MRFLYVFGNLKVSFFFPYSCSRGDFSHCASFIFFIKLWEMKRVSAGPRTRQRSVSSRTSCLIKSHRHCAASVHFIIWPSWQKRKEEVRHSNQLHTRYQLIRFYGIDYKSRPLSVRKCLGVFFFNQKFPIWQNSNCLIGTIQLQYVAPAYILQLHLQIRPDTRKLCSFTPGSAVWDCLKPSLHPCVGFVWVVQFQIQDLSLCPCSR